MVEKTAIARDIKNAVGSISGKDLQSINLAQKPVLPSIAAAPINQSTATSTPPPLPPSLAGAAAQAPSNRQEIPLGAPAQVQQPKITSNLPPLGVSSQKPATAVASPAAAGNAPASPPAAPAAPAPAPSSGGSGLDEDAETKIAQIKKDVEKLTTLVTSLKNNVDKASEKMENLDETIANLASVYEVVTNQINPFIDHPAAGSMASPMAPASPPMAPPMPPVVQSIPLSAPEPIKPVEPPIVEKKPIVPVPPAPTAPVASPMTQTRPPMAPEENEAEENAFSHVQPPAPMHAENRLKRRTAPASAYYAQEPAIVEHPAPAKHREFVLSDIDATDIKQLQNVLEWVAFLLLKVGHSGLPRALEYYRNVGWISNSVKDRLEDYAKGIEIEDEPKKSGKEGLPLSDQKRSLELFYKIVDQQMER